MPGLEEPSGFVESPVSSIPNTRVYLGAQTAAKRPSLEPLVTLEYLFPRASPGGPSRIPFLNVEHTNPKRVPPC